MKNNTLLEIQKKITKLPRTQFCVNLNNKCIEALFPGDVYVTMIDTPSKEYTDLTTWEIRRVGTRNIVTFEERFVEVRKKIRDKTLVTLLNELFDKEVSKLIEPILVYGD